MPTEKLNSMADIDAEISAIEASMGAYGAMHDGAQQAHHQLMVDHYGVEVIEGEESPAIEGPTEEVVVVETSEQGWFGKNKAGIIAGAVGVLGLVVGSKY